MRRALVPVAMVVALVLGAGSAAGRSAATTTITVGIVGTGTVTSSPAGISCPSTCTFGFTGTSTIVLTPSATASGWSFAGWDCAGSNEVVVSGTCQITPAAGDSTHNVTATFVFTPPPPSPPAGVSAVSVIGKGQVTSPKGIKCGDGKKTCALNLGGPATLTQAETAKGWTFAHWNDWDLTDGSDGPCDSDTSDTCDVPDDGHDHLITATFSGPPASTRTLSATFTGSGTITGGNNEIDCGSAGSTCSWSVPDGSVLTVVETPEAGSVFSGWGGACSGASISCTTEMSTDRGVSATWSDASNTALLSVSVTGSGHVSGGGINCPSSCVSNQALNSSVTLKASPNDGYLFTSWSGGCTGASPTCTVTMTAATTVVATFTQANVLAVAISGNGSVTGGSGAINCGGGASICAANFAAGASISLVATPATGATFTGWTGACGGSATTCTIAMNQSKSVTATFSGGTPAPTGFTLTVTVVGNGTVTGSGINCGAGATTCTSSGHTTNSSETLTATPSPGATFSGWSGGTCTGTATTCTVTFNASKTVIATFSGGTSTVALKVSSSGPGRVSGGGISCGNGASTCGASYPAGTTITLTATPASGATFGGWSGACTGTATKCTVSMTAAKSVSATFASAGGPGTLTLHVTGRGAVATAAGTCASTGPLKTCIQHFKPGSSVTLTARPAAGRSFLGWHGSCSGTRATCRVTLTRGATVTAAFSGATSPPLTTGTLTSLGAPIVVKTSAGYNVTLRFLTTVPGTARVRSIRAGRNVASVAARVGAGRVRVGPFPVARSGFYTFEIRLAGDLLRMRACLGSCGSAAPPPTFVLVREAPSVTRTGDVWSVTLHVRANQIYDGRMRTFRAGRLVVNQHFLGQAGRVALGPFLLGPGNYTLRLAGVDGYGRARALTWIVSLGR